MAITKLKRIKEGTNNSGRLHMKELIIYVMDPRKCEGDSGTRSDLGNDPNLVYQLMIRNKEIHGKLDGSQCFHYVLSWPPDTKITQDEALDIADEFRKELLGDNYHYVLAFHTDKPHPHVHVVFDSVAHTTGRKFHSPKGDWKYRIQPLMDRLCEERGLPRLEIDLSNKTGNLPYNEWRHEKETQQGKIRVPTNDITWYDIVRDDIDTAIENTDTYEDFLSYLKNEKYEITRDSVHLALKPQGREKAIRTQRLGAGYSKEEIQARIENKQWDDDIWEKSENITPEQRQQKIIFYGYREEICIRVRRKKSTYKSWLMSAYQQAMWERYEFLYRYRQPRRYNPNERARLREDLLQLHNLCNAINYTIDHDLKNEEDLNKERLKLNEETRALEVKTNSLQSKLYRSAAYKIMKEYDELSEMPETSENEKKKKELQEKIKDLGGENVLREMIADNRYELQDLRSARKKIREEQKNIDNALEQIHLTKAQEPVYTEIKKRRSDEKKRYREEPDEAKENHSGKNRGTRHQITINKVLFGDMSQPALYNTRIPGQKDFIDIPKKDCFMYESGDILSAFIYEDETYNLTDRNGNIIGTMTGKDAIHHYEDKTKKNTKTQNGPQAQTTKKKKGRTF